MDDNDIGRMEKKKCQKFVTHIQDLKRCREYTLTISSASIGAGLRDFNLRPGGLRLYIFLAHLMVGVTRL